MHDITALGLGSIPFTQKITTHTLGNYLSSASDITNMHDPDGGVTVLLL